MTEKEAINILDNIFIEILIEKELGTKYKQAIKTLLTFYKYWRNGFERELESNRENIIEIIEKDFKIKELVKAMRENGSNYWANKLEELL